jgi:hypothetical protein
MNPLDSPGTVFELGLLNPNPTSSKTKDGPIYRLSFEVERETWDWFMEAETKGMLLAARATVVEQEEEAALVPEKSALAGPYSREAQALVASGFFRVVAVWNAVGSDEEFRGWVAGQPCAARSVESAGPCAGDIVAAHVRRVSSGAGTGIKPPYSCIPLCDRHHGLAHQHGDSHLGPREWWDRRRIEAVEKWARASLVRQLGEDSLTRVDPVVVREWARQKGFGHLIPTNGYVFGEEK